MSHFAPEMWKSAPSVNLSCRLGLAKLLWSEKRVLGALSLLDLLTTTTSENDDEESALRLDWGRVVGDERAPAGFEAASAR